MIKIVGGVIAILKDKTEKLCFTYFSRDQWEMILDVSSITEGDIDETIRGIVYDLGNVIFVDPEELD
jgi:hypothetical protein